jgi:Fe-S cluster biogenesis protein NfuA
VNHDQHMIEEQQVRKQADEIERLIREIETITDPELREKVVTLVQSLMALHAAGIERLMKIIRDDVELSRSILNELANDNLVASLLLLYGVHPFSIEVRVEQALNRLRSSAILNGGNVELLGISDGIVRLGVQNQKNCQSSKQALRTAIEEALYEAAPDVVEIQFADEVQAPSVSFVPLISLRSKNGFISTLNRPLPKA